MAGKLDVGIGGDAAKLIRELERSQEHTNKLARKLIEAGQAGKRGQEEIQSSASGTDTAMSGLISKAVLWGASIVSVRAAYSQIVGVLDEIEKKKLAAMEAGKGSEMAYAGLSQFGARKGELEKQAEDLYAGKGKLRAVKTIDEGADIVTVLEQSKLNTEENRETIRGLFTPLRGQTAQFTKDIAKYIAGYGAEDAGDINEVVSKAVVARREAVGMSFQDLIAATAQMAPMAGMIGWTDEEVMGGLTELSKTMSPEKAITSMTGMIRGLTKEEGLAGRPLPEQLGEIKGYTEERLRTSVLGPDLYGELERALPEMTMKEGNKTVHPFKKLTVKESMAKAAGMTEAELADTMGPYAEAIQAALDQNVSYVGMGFADMLKSVAASGRTETELMKLFPRGTAAAALMLSKEPALDSLEKLIVNERQAGVERVAEDMTARALSSPEVRGVEEAETAKQRALLIDKGAGIEGQFGEAAIEHKLNAFEEAGESHAMQVGREKVMRLKEWWRGEAGPEMSVRELGSQELQGQYYGARKAMATGGPIVPSNSPWEPLGPYVEPSGSLVMAENILKGFALAFGLMQGAADGQKAAAETNKTAAQLNLQAAQLNSGGRVAPARGRGARPSKVDFEGDL